MAQGELPFDGDSKPALASFDSAGDEQAPSIFAHIGEERLKLPADARQIRVSRFGIDVRRNIYSKKTQSVRGGVNRKIMRITKS